LAKRYKKRRHKSTVEFAPLGVNGCDCEPNQERCGYNPIPDCSASCNVPKKKLSEQPPKMAALVPGIPEASTRRKEPKNVYFAIVGGTR
jgi:hypothetical protein